VVGGALACCASAVLAAIANTKLVPAVTMRLVFFMMILSSDEDYDDASIGATL
jgi:hypothetical protein